MPTFYTVQSRCGRFSDEGGRSRKKNMHWNNKPFIRCFGRQCADNLLTAPTFTTQVVKYPRVLATKHRLRCGCYLIISIFFRLIYV